MTPRGSWRHAFVHYESGATIFGNSNNKHIDGYAAFTGSGGFDFPIGDGIRERQAGISTALSGTFRCAYFNASAGSGTTGISGNNAMFGSYNGGITRVSSGEFWDIDGTAQTNIRLSALNSVPGYSEWDTGPNFAGSASSAITISGFDPWEELGINSAPASLAVDGSFTSMVPITPDPNFSSFTFASSAIILPVTMTLFEGVLKNNDVILNWKTASEVNNDKFEIEYSFNGQLFEKAGEVFGNGNTNAPMAFKD